MSKAASVNWAVRTAAAAFIGKVGALTVTAGDATTAAAHLAVCQENLAAIASISAAVVC